MHRLIEQAISNAGIINKPLGHSVIAEGPVFARPPFKEQARSDASLSPIRIHQPVDLAAEIPLIHLSNDSIT
jgi:hypothetical protein